MNRGLMAMDRKTDSGIPDEVPDDVLKAIAASTECESLPQRRRALTRGQRSSTSRAGGSPNIAATCDAQGSVCGGLHDARAYALGILGLLTLFAVIVGGAYTRFFFGQISSPPVPMATGAESRVEREPTARRVGESVAAEGALPVAPTAAASSPAPSAEIDVEVDSVVLRMLAADEAFSRVKLDLLDLQRAERQRSIERQQVRDIARAMATGRLHLHFGPMNQAGVSMELVYVPPGSFRMGHTNEERRTEARVNPASHYDFSVPAHNVQVESGFFIGIHEVTRLQWQAFRRAISKTGPMAIPSSNAGDNDDRKPAAHVTWDAAVAFCDWLALRNQMPVRLPTEIEWEYAARGNEFVQQFESLHESISLFGGPWPTDEPKLDRAWCLATAMNSNVQEWCIDAWDDNRYAARVSAMSNASQAAFRYLPLAAATPDKAALRVVRGASFRDVPANRDPALRRYKAADTAEETVGFRVVVPVSLDVLFRGQ